MAQQRPCPVATVVISGRASMRFMAESTERALGAIKHS
jgi:hypothetical protein